MGRDISLVRRWLTDEAGQDLVEYALLCGALGLAGVAGMTVLRDAMGGAYEGWTDEVQSSALVEMPDPTTTP